MTGGSRARYDRCVRAAIIPILVAAAGASAALGARAGERRLVDEVVAVVDAHSITLSEVAAEARIHLVEEQGAQLAEAALDRPMLAAALRRLIEERIVLSEVERLKLFDLERSDFDDALARFRAHFPSEERYQSFRHELDLTEEELGVILARDLRVARYLDNRLKLAAQLRDSELDEVLKAKDPPAGPKAREEIRRKLSREKYERLLAELLAELRRRAFVRVLDPIDKVGPGRPAQALDGVAPARGP